MPSPCSAEIAMGSPRPSPYASSSPASAARPSALVGEDDDRLAMRAQPSGEFAVDRRHAGARIDDEEADIGIVDRRLGLRAHAVFEAAARRLVEARRVENAEPEIGEAGLAFAAVARDAGLIVDKRDLAADQPVEQRRFADIRPAENCDRGGHDQI